MLLLIIGARCVATIAWLFKLKQWLWVRLFPLRLQKAHVSNQDGFTHEGCAWRACSEFQHRALENKRISARAGCTSSAPPELPLPNDFLLSVQSWDSIHWSLSPGKPDRWLAASNAQFMDVEDLCAAYTYWFLHKWAIRPVRDAWIMHKPELINLCREDTTYLFLLRLN